MRRACGRSSASSRRPGGIPSHVSVPTPGSIHEGGELGYVLAHAFGAAFDNPDLIVAAVVGDGEAETGPLAGSWKGTSFLNPARDGAVLPILHLNGYKIANPTVLGRVERRRRARAASRATATRSISSKATIRRACTRNSPRRWTPATQRIRAIQTGARAQQRLLGATALAGDRAAHAQGLDRAEGGATGCRWRAPSARIRCRSTDVAHRSRAARAARRRGCAAISPERTLRRDGRLVPELAALAPQGDRRMGANPHANGGRLLVDLDLPDFRDYALPVDTPGDRAPRIHPPARQDAARHLHAQRRGRRISGSSARTRPTRTAWAMSSRSRTAASSARRSTSTTTSRPTAA